MEVQQKPILVRSPLRYRNHFRWRIRPPEHATEQGYFDRSFATKKQALAYQKRVKARFPDHPCCLIDTGQYMDVMGNIVR